MKVNELKNLNIPYTLIQEFNKKSYPITAHGFDEYYQYRFIDNPFCEYPNDTIYSVMDNGKYIAQMMTMPAPLSYNETSINAYWGQDYMVSNEYQGKGIGKKLSSLFLSKNYYIAVGFTPISSIVHKKGGCRCIGILDFYQKWLSPLHKIKFLFHRLLKVKLKPLQDYNFPKEIENWMRIDNVEDFHFPKKNWNKDTVETLRDKKYMQWRFFYLPNRYFCYQLSPENQEENATYFVCKIYFHRGVHWLYISDYRFKKENPNDFNKIISIAENLAKKFNLFGIIFPSSMEISNNILEKHLFEKTAHKEVLTTYPFAHQPMDENDKMHNNFFISFSDSDIDTRTNQGHFIYGKNY